MEDIGTSHIVKTYIELIKHNRESFEHAHRANSYYWAIEDLDKLCRYELPEIEVIKTGLTKEDAMLLEHELVRELKPKFNKAVVIKEPDDLDFNSIIEVKEYLKIPL